MAIEAVSALRIGGLDNIPAPPVDNGSFVGKVVSEFRQIDSALVDANEAVLRLATGQDSNIHNVMMEIEKARLQFELAVEVRNKLVEGVQEVMRMSV